MLLLQEKKGEFISFVFWLQIRLISVESLLCVVMVEVG